MNSGIPKLSGYEEYTGRLEVSIEARKVVAERLRANGRNGEANKVLQGRPKHSDKELQLAEKMIRGL